MLLTNDGSPYAESRRLVRMSKLLPIGQVINAREGTVTTNYYQYLVFIRNSDWAEPMR